jgi:hypothetical protein
MNKRLYYSIRTGKHPTGGKLDLLSLLNLFSIIYSNFESSGYFQEAFGYSCVDQGFVPGSLGSNIGGNILLRLRKDNLWPIDNKCENYKEDDLFDIIEYLYDYISKPINGTYHGWNDCGWHYDKFDKEVGRTEFRDKINDLLKDYNNCELSSNGEILKIVMPGAEELINHKIPDYDRNNVNDRVEEAILLFRRYRSSLTDRKNAIKNLVDVLEFLRPQIKKVLTQKDENDLFNIANNFGIRHHDNKQKINYDQEIWLNWMFYYYLSTINAVIRLTQRPDQKTLL